MNTEKHISIIGAGRSSSALIQYLDQVAAKENWTLYVSDQNIDLAIERCEGMNRCKAITFDALDAVKRREHLKGKNLVISMLPARFHLEVVKDCINMGIHVITPSYVTPEIQELDGLAKEKGVLVLNEMGLDPGIDHMSAMKIIHHLQALGANVTAFKSFTGGLVAPESDNNPWNYKITWNPRNVVLAGQGGASQFIRNGNYKYIPYHRLFTRTEPIFIEGYGEFEGYANRNSLQYREVYGLGQIPTIFRGTLRRKGYSEAWDVFVQLGLTDDTYTLEDSEHMTFRDYLNSYLRYEDDKSVEAKLCEFLSINPDGEVMKKLVWLGIFEKKAIGLKNATPAQVLQLLLEQKWKLNPGDKDMIAMYHYFEYEKDGKQHRLSSHMISIGLDPIYTGMARTVGLPIAIYATHLLKGECKLTGVHLPTIPEIYTPILNELAAMGIVFLEKELK
jgi:saccharopine dehydrogenase-like NADP-dependent oxidoreductase